MKTTSIVEENGKLREALAKKDEDLNKALKLLDNMSGKMNELATDNSNIYQKYSEALHQLEDV